jgi:branched-chain amino acid aminotransferase
MAVKLQKPPYVFFGGKLRSWDEANFHISTEAVVRGLNVFEGLKAYWQRDGSIGLVAVERHWRRLQRSARLLHIPFEMTLEDFEANCHALVAKLCRSDSDIWVRATLYVVDGHWGEGTVSDLVLTAYHQPKIMPEPLDIGVSTWRRSSDLALPTRIKTSANYLVARLGKIEGRSRGYTEMVVLNSAGRVAEALGCCVVIVRDGVVITPPASEGALESITVDIVEDLAKSMDVPFVRRPVDRSELYIADEMALVGTLVEVTPVRSIDGLTFDPKRPIVSALTRRYFAAVRGEDPHERVDLSCRRVRVGTPELV